MGGMGNEAVCGGGRIQGHIKEERRKGGIQVGGRGGLEGRIRSAQVMFQELRVGFRRFETKPRSS